MAAAVVVWITDRNEVEAVGSAYALWESGVGCSVGAEASAAAARVLECPAGVGATEAADVVGIAWPASAMAAPGLPEV